MMTQPAPNNPLQGVTLQALLTDLVARYGWDGLAQKIDIRCFKNNPSMSSSLSFLRRTPWARSQLEQLWIKQLSSPHTTQ
ncbi:MAG: VF530 family protein [Herbaspirillum sp.]